MDTQRRNHMALALAQMLLLLAGASLAGNDTPRIDVVRIRGDVTIEEGRVVKSAVAIMGSVTVLSGGRVMETAVAVGGEILSEEGASVGGDEVAIMSGAKHLIPDSLFDVLFGFYLASLMLHILMVLPIALLGIFLLLFLPGPLQIITSTIRQSALKSGGWGVGSMVLIVLLVVLTTGSLLGIVLAPVLIIAVAVAGILGCVATGLSVGERTISPSAGSLIRPFLVGMLVLAALSLIPLVGAFVFLVANFFGFGAVLVSRFGRAQPPAAEVL